MNENLEILKTSWPAWATLGLMVLAIIGMYVSPLIEARRKKQRILDEKNAEVRRIANLPKLDTTHMLKMDVTDEDRAMYRKEARTFGSRYCHLMVTDTDGTPYLCFMTAYNMRALAQSEFHQANYTPLLREQDVPRVVLGVDITVFPNYLARFHNHHHAWIRWAQLHLEFEKDNPGTSYFRHFERYYDGKVPRKEPLKLVA